MLEVGVAWHNRVGMVRGEVERQGPKARQRFRQIKDQPSLKEALRSGVMIVAASTGLKLSGNIGTHMLGQPMLDMDQIRAHAVKPGEAFRIHRMDLEEPREQARAASLRQYPRFQEHHRVRKVDAGVSFEQALELLELGVFGKLNENRVARPKPRIFEEYALRAGTRHRLSLGYCAVPRALPP